MREILRCHAYKFGLGLSSVNDLGLFLQDSCFCLLRKLLRVKATQTEDTT